MGIMVFNATFKKYFSYIMTWWSVLLVEETGVPGETTDMLQVRQTLSHNVVSSTTRLGGIRTHNVSIDRH